MVEISATDETTCALLKRLGLFGPEVAGSLGQSSPQ